MPRSPHGALDITGEIDATARTALPYHNSGFICVWLRRIGQLGRIRHVAGHDGQDRLADWFYWETEFGTGNPVGIGEAFENRMLLFDAGVEGIAVGSDDVARFLDTEHFGQPEVLAALVAFGVHAGFKRGEQRTA